MAGEFSARMHDDMSDRHGQGDDMEASNSRMDYGGSSEILFFSPRKDGDCISAGHGSSKPSLSLDLSSVCDQVFADMKLRGEMSDDDMSRLNLLFKTTTLYSSLSLVEKGMVQKCISPNGRSLFLVEGSQAEPYGILC